MKASKGRSGTQAAIGAEDAHEAGFEAGRFEASRGFTYDPSTVPAEFRADYDAGYEDGYQAAKRGGN